MKVIFSIHLRLLVLFLLLPAAGFAQPVPSGVGDLKPTAPLSAANPAASSSPVTQEQIDSSDDIDPEQTDLHPTGVGDCLFGLCVAMEGSTLVVGGSGASYVYEDGRLTARLCPDADATNTGYRVNSVSISDGAIAIGTFKGVYVLIATPRGWKVQARLKIPDPSTVVIDHDNLVVASSGKSIAGGAIAFYRRTGGAWKLVPNEIRQNPASYSADLFGHIAALDDSWAVLGAPDWSEASYDNFGSPYSGRAYVARYDGAKWKQALELDPDDGPSGANQFGGSVALCGDAIAIASGNHDHIDYASHHGVVYLFRRDGDTWKKDTILKSPNAANDAAFGNAPIALSGQTLAVADTSVKASVLNVVLSTGDKIDKPGVINNAGVVYVYENKVLQGTLPAPDPTDGLERFGSTDRFASSLAVSGDTIAVGAPGKDGGTGAVYLWKRQGGQWRLDSELKGFQKQIDFRY